MSETMFYLMHRTDEVAILSVDPISGAILKVGHVTRKELLPLGGRQSTDHLRKWWQRRAVPISQGRMAQILHQADIPSTQHLLVQNLGLSLSDHYWIRPLNSNLQWHDVNLFTNDFSDPIGSAQFSGEDQDAASYTTFRGPASSLQGDLKKRWMIVDGKRMLLKGNRGFHSQESLNEVIASKLHEKQGFQNHVVYEPYALSDGQYGCLCEDFATPCLEFVPAIDVVESVKRDNAVSMYEHFIAVCVQNGLAERPVRSFLEYQILTDFVLTNTDRHLNNFGVLRDSKTLQFVAMAPIFDSGNAMFCENPRVALRKDLTEITVNSFRQKEKQLLGYVRDKRAVDVGKLPDSDEIAQVYALDPMIPHIDAVLQGYQKKIALLEQYQKN